MINPLDYKVYTGKVISVYDGDTFTILFDLGFSIQFKEVVRLYGVDTPELRTKNLAEKKRGYAAKKFVEQLILNKTFPIRTYKEGKFGRYLVDISVDAEPLSEILIKKGHAVAYFGGKR